MRVVLVLCTTTLLLAGCKRETQEAVAQAKGAAADAERAAKAAAEDARAAANQARASADEAAAKAREAADQARGAAAGAADSARHGLDGTTQKLKEMTAGDQVEGVLVTTGSTEIDVRPESGPVQTLHTDARTKWLFRGTSRQAFSVGATVRATYIVQAGQKVATLVEAVDR